MLALVPTAENKDNYGETPLMVAAYNDLVAGNSRYTITDHLRSFCDLVVNEFNKSGTEAGHVSKRISAITAMIWKYNIIPPDKLMLCLVLRTYEGNKFHVSWLLQRC